MSSGVGPYVLPTPTDTSADPAVLETTIVAAKTPAVDLGLPGGQLADLETYNGAVPGPLLRLNVDDTVIVRLINLLDHPTGIHWHGIELSNSADGTEVTQEPVLSAFPTPPPAPAPAGGSYLYKFKVPRPGLYWYHPHHHLSTNRVFKGLYGMIVVADPAEAAIVGTVLPSAANTRQLVLSDITVCRAVNDAATYPDPSAAMPASDAAEWLSGSTSQPAPTPRDLCEVGTGSATDEEGMPAAMSYPAGAVPSIIRPPGRLNEGQTVLTNGYHVGGRPGTPGSPGTLPPTAHALDVQSGDGIRLQIVNCATTRYFRLRLTTGAGAQVNLLRVGGEGGLLDTAQLEGGTIGTYDTKYELGEILIPPASRADVVAAIPAGLPAGHKLTLWTRDFQRLGPVGSSNAFADLPSVPVMHLNVTGAAASTYTIAHGDALRPVASPVETLGPTSETLLAPATFVPPKDGSAAQNIQVTTSGGAPGIDNVPGNFEGFVPYSSAPHIAASSRYAERGDLLELSVTNTSGAHHPFHLHGFSFQPVSLAPRPGAPAGTTSGSVGPPWPYREFRDNFDIPAHYRFTFRVRLDDRPLVDGTTLGGSLGRWLFHCHIFFHHHQGMISELVVTNTAGKEKPNVDVGGSWAYVPAGGIARRRGTYSSPDSAIASITATTQAGTPIGAVTYSGGVWEWEYNTAMVPTGVQYVYVTATDAIGLQDQTVFRLKIGAPDDGGDAGDPHIRTVDGKYYDFQAAGEFVLLRDVDGLEVQARQTPVPTATPIPDGYSGLTVCVSVNTAVAARVGAHRISYQAVRSGDERLQFFLDGKPTDLTPRGIDLEAGRVVPFAVGDATGLRVDYANEAVLTVTPYFWSSYNIWILNVHVSRTDADQGIMGRIPPQTWLPLLPNGASLGPKPADQHARYVALYRTFANAWRVTDQNSLFVYAPGTSTKTFTDLAWPPEKPACTRVKPELAIPGANPPLVNLKLETAKRVCRPVTLDDLRRGCVFDVATTGDRALVEAYQRAQETRIRGTAVQIVADRPLARVAEPVRLTATVAPLTSGQPVPAGTISFLVDDAPIEKPVDVDKSGRAVVTTDSLTPGVHRVRAAFRARDDRNAYHDSSSPSLRLRVERRKGEDRARAPYQLRGLFYEACDCFVVCPCWLGDKPDGGECTGVFAWEIEQGAIDGVEVAGLRVVSVSQHTGPRDQAKQRVMMFVDERASRRQADAMSAAFSGRLGGPLQELADILGELVGVERAAIMFGRQGRLTTLTVGHRIRVEGTTIRGPSGHPMQLNDGRLSEVLGTPASVGESGRFRVALSDHGMNLDVRGRSTMSGRFAYTHVPGAERREPRRHG